MCEVCGNISVYAKLAGFDPTRTTALRNAFARDLKNRFVQLKRLIVKAIVEENVFALNTENQLQVSIQVNVGTTPGRRAFDFTTNQQKINSFMAWLQRQQDDGLLDLTAMPQLGGSIDRAWTDLYIADSYKRGLMRARQEMIKAGYDVPPIEETGGIEASMSTPFHADRVGVLYTRTFTDLKGITNAMDQQISRVLAMGLVDGDSPRTLAKKLLGVVDGSLDMTDTLGRYIPAQRRAEILARTEIIRAHHAATIQEYKNWGVAGVEVQAEFRNAGDSRVCSICSSLQGTVYSLDDAYNVIPVHPQCRCIMLPINAKVVGGGEKEAWMDDPIAMSFKDAANGKKYYQIKQGYLSELQALKETDDFIARQEFFKNESLVKIGNENEFSLHSRKLRVWVDTKPELESFYRLCTQWQGSTQNEFPLAYKMRAFELEKDIPDVIFKNTFEQSVLDDLATSFSREDYLHARAFNQAYMDVFIDGDFFELYRGIGGNTGSKIKEDILREGMSRTRWNIKESSISGYTSDWSTADYFGRDGVVIRRTFNKKDIHIHYQCLSGMTGNYWGEMEWVMAGKSEYVDINNIRFNNGGWTGFKYKHE